MLRFAGRRRKQGREKNLGLNSNNKTFFKVDNIATAANLKPIPRKTRPPSTQNTHPKMSRPEIDSTNNDDQNEDDLDNLFSLLEMHEDFNKKVDQINAKLDRLEQCERRLKVFQEVHNTLAVEVDTIKEKNKSSKTKTLQNTSTSNNTCNNAVTLEILHRILDDRDSRLRKEREKAIKSLCFFSDDEDCDADTEDHDTDRQGQSQDLGAISKVASKKEERQEESFASILAKPRETKSVQTEETSENSSQADIAESMIWQFVNSDLRAKMREVIEDTLRGRMQNTLHSLLDRALESMVEESFEQAAGDKTLDRVMEAVRKEVESVLDGCVKREVKKARQEIMGEVKSCMDKIVKTNNNNNNNKHLSADAKEFVPSVSPPRTSTPSPPSSSSAPSLTMARIFSPQNLRPMTTLGSGSMVQQQQQQAPLVFHQQLAPHFK